MAHEPRNTDQLEHGRVGVPGVVFMVLAAVAPMAAVVAIVPLAIALGVGIGAPGAWLLVGVVLTLFAVGFTAMSRYVRNAGGFYTYAARGLGKPFGASAALVAVVAYNAMVIMVTVIFAVFAQDIIGGVLHVDIAWQIWAAIGILMVGALAWREVDVSAKVLGVALVLEVTILLVMDVAILADRGLGAFTLDVFDPSVVFSAAPGIALLLAFSTYIGFEQTAIYSEEARDPGRTIPRAAYLAVGLVTGFYIVTSWALIAGAGADQAREVAGDDPASFVFAVNDRFVGGFTTDLMQVLVITSMFAALLSLHNGTARYLFALGRERLLPRVLGRTHPNHHSPYVASFVQLSITVLAIVPFAIAGTDPYLGIGTSMAGLGTLGVMVLQAYAAVSVIGFFRRRRDPRWWTTLVAPLLGAAGIATAVVLALVNYSALTGKTSGLANQLPWLLLGAGLIGLAYGVWLRTARPDVYAGIGVGGEAQDLVMETVERPERVATTDVLAPTSQPR